MDATLKPRQRVTDAQIIEAYETAGSVHKAAKIVGLNHTSVHERLVKMGRMKRKNYFTEADAERLRRDYARYRQDGRVAELADEMGRTVQFLSRQAGKLGLATFHYERHDSGTWKYMGSKEARAVMDDLKASGMTLNQFCQARGYSRDGLQLAVRSRWPDEWEHTLEAAVPMGTAYRVGREFEYRVRDDLETLGYSALRSSRSRGLADVMAYRQGEILFVQCKGVVGDIPGEEWGQIYDMATSVGAVPIMAWPDADGSPKYVELTGHKDGQNATRRPSRPFVPGVDITIRSIE